MAKQTINIGSTANDGTGSTLRVGGDLINDNFNEIYTTFGDGSTLSNAIPGKVQGANFTGSLLVGHSITGALNNAKENTGIGIEALDALTSGDDNVGVGYRAGTAITTGHSNTVIGRMAGAGLTTTSQNTLIGTSAGGVGTLTGDENVGIGAFALGTAGSANNNVAVGRNAGRNVTGNKNTLIGNSAGNNVTSGDGNVILGGVNALSATGDRQLLIAGNDGTTTTTWISGDSSGNLVTPGTITANGTLLGAGLAHKLGGTEFANSLLVGHSTTGTLSNATHNTGVGNGSLGSLTSGDKNTGVGSLSFNGLSSGQSNTAIGYGAGSYSGTPIQGVFIGEMAGRSGAGTGNIGIGKDASRSTTGNYNISLGYESADNLTSGNGNVFIGTGDIGSATGDRQLIINGYDGTNTTTWISGDSAGLLTITGGEVIPGKKGGTNFGNSLLVGHATTGTLSNANRDVGVGIGSLAAITVADDNTALGYNSGRDLTSGGSNTIIGNESNLSGNPSGSASLGYQALKVNAGTNNIGIGRQAGKNISSGSGNVIIGVVDAGSATGDRQLKITGYDGTTTTTWIDGDSSGNVTMTLAADQITSTQLTGATNLQILASDGTVLKTLFGAGS
jgi:hypothetical protein